MFKSQLKVSVALARDLSCLKRLSVPRYAIPFFFRFKASQASKHANFSLLILSFLACEGLPYLGTQPLIIPIKVFRTTVRDPVLAS